ncbi:hypothetical protein KCU61_g559, partial [Aureobasidium melanogenum]
LDVHQFHAATPLLFALPAVHVWKPSGTAEASSGLDEGSGLRLSLRFAPAFLVRDMVESFLLTASRAISLLDPNELLVFAPKLDALLDGPDLSPELAVILSSYGVAYALLLDVELAAWLRGNCESSTSCSSLSLLSTGEDGILCIIRIIIVVFRHLWKLFGWCRVIVVGHHVFTHVVEVLVSFMAVERDLV